MTTRPYIAQQGDYLAQIASRLGVDPADVWNHDENRDLREQRGDGSILAPGDVLHVPARGAPRPRVSKGANNRYTVNVASVALVVTLRDVEGRPLANKAFVVHGPPTPIRGTTDGNGAASFSVPTHLREVHLVVEEIGRVYRLAVGHMDPVETPTGLRKRLAHLGHYIHVPAGDGHSEDEHLRRSILSFQRSQSIPETGEMNEQTRNVLVAAHGS